MKKKISLAIVIIGILCLALLCACGEEKRSSREIIEELTVYYGTYGDEAQGKAKDLLNELKSVDSDQYDKWNEIMRIWDEENANLEIHLDKLPEGLPQTDELCLVALGFQLKPDGTMKPELLERLKVLKNCAEEYPNAFVLCTGGGTAAENKLATEAGQMAKWLKENGIDPNRIIVENKSQTTAQNAMYSYDILTTKYPQVTQIAIVSSDYHIATGELLFKAESILRAEKLGEEKIKVVSNAAYKAPSGQLSTMFQAGALIELSGDKDTAFDIYYDTYDIHELPALK